jgi:hypothetical protein
MLLLPASRPLFKGSSECVNKLAVIAFQCRQRRAEITRSRVHCIAMAQREEPRTMTFSEAISVDLEPGDLPAVARGRGAQASRH